MLLDIEGFPEYKFDTETWSVYSLRRSKHLLNSVDKNLHFIVGLCHDMKAVRRPLHRIVFEVFNGPVPKGFDVHHIDGNPQNNSLSNLTLISHSEHIKLHHTGLRHTDASKQAMSEHRSKPVEMLDKERNLIKTYPSGKATAQDGFEPTCVNHCLKGKQKTHKGYIFQYA